jgi:6,7-dimethyl-8-ribityllumazine synthase
MGTALPPKPRLFGSKRVIAIVASQYNPVYVQAMVNYAREELSLSLPNATVTLHQVPGAFEIPLLVQEIASLKNVDAIIALGVIIQGETAHAEHIGQTISDALMDIGLRFRTPVIHEVLTLRNEEQAQARCLDSRTSRGIEAARSAVEMAQLMAELKK